MSKKIATAFALLLAAANGQPIDHATENGYIAWVEGLLGVRVSPAQRDRIRQHVAGYVASRNAGAIRTVQQSAAQWNQSQQQPRELAGVAFRMSRPDTLLGLHQAAAGGHSDSKYLLDIYYEANPILAPGKPGGLPLTRDMVEGDLALKHWWAVEIQRQNATKPDAHTLETALHAAVRAHPVLSAAEQVRLARQPAEWARISYSWPRTSPMDKLLARNDLGGSLTPQEKAQLQQFLAGLNAQLQGMQTQHRNAMLGGIIAAAKENTDVIMGRGTVWNPSTNRWEQQGGIVTEYDGRVRVP
jgi:hypothetical protein